MPCNITYLLGIIASMSIITEQERQALHYLSRGFSKAAAAKAAGLPSSAVFERAHVQEALSDMNTEVTAEIKVTRDTLTQMLFESHRKSATATEEIAAAREIGKLHGLYESDKMQQTNINVNVIEQIESLPVGELLELANMQGVHTLSPDEYHVKED